ncbi:MAG: DUF1887 family CARF protein [Desulfuromusa sp.]
MLEIAQILFSKESTMINTHLCLVSSQPIPNLVPVFEPDQTPQQVVLLSSDQMKPYAVWLQQVLQQRQIKSEVWSIPDAYDCDHIKARIETLLKRQDLGNIALNVTAGTKIMSLAAYEVFRAHGLPIFYVHPQKDLLIPLLPAGSAREIPDKLRLEEFFQVHGYKVMSLRRQTVARDRQQLGEYLVKNVGIYSSALGTLNYLAATAEDRSTLQSDRIVARNWNVDGFKSLVDLLVDGGLLRVEADCFTFASEEDRFFVNGGWLEEYLFSRIDRLRNRFKIQDSAMSVQVESSTGTKNEIDVAILHNNRLFLIECKTRRFRGQHSAGSKALYRMDSLKIMGGITAQAMLASYRRLTASHHRRAEDLKIDLIVGAELLNIEQRLEDWLLNS